MSNNSCEFRIYITSLSDYTNAILHGTWIDFNDCADVGDVWDAINAMLSASPFAASDFAKQHGLKAEEWAIHDYELPGNMRISEYENIEGLWTVFENIQNIEDHEIDPFFIFLGKQGGTHPMSSDIDEFREAYRGQYSSEKDFAEELVDALGYLDQIPENLRYYFDYESFARDIFITDYWMTDGHVFSNC